MSNKKDVFLCHASEDKPSVVRPFVNALDEAGISYWYDEAEIKWGDSIVEKVNEGLRISQYVIVVLSEFFISKNWPQQELNSALNIEASSGDVRVLPLLVGTDNVKKQILDKYPILNDKASMPWGKNTKAIIGALKGRLSHPKSVETSSSECTFDIPLPNIKRKFTQRDKDLFIKKSFETIKSYFQNGLAQLQKQSSEVETDFTEIHHFKFISTIYVHGEVKSRCKIWLGSPFSSDSIAYQTGTNNMSIDSDNSCNGWLTIVDDGYNLGFNASKLGFFSSDYEKNEFLSPKNAAEYLWKSFTEILKY